MLTHGHSELAMLRKMIVVQREVYVLFLFLKVSHSDGRDKFLFLAAAPRRGPKDKEPAATAPPAVAAHQMAAAYLARGVPPRRTFLPYREELVGFFANVNGISRSHHRPPF